VPPFSPFITLRSVPLLPAQVLPRFIILLFFFFVIFFIFFFFLGFFLGFPFCLFGLYRLPQAPRFRTRMGGL